MRRRNRIAFRSRRIVLVVTLTLIASSAHADGPAGSEGELQIKEGSTFGAVSVGEGQQILSLQAGEPVWKDFAHFPTREVTIADDQTAGQYAVKDDLILDRTYHGIKCLDADGCEVEVIVDAGYENDGQIAFITNTKPVPVIVREAFGFYIGGDVTLQQNESLLLFRSNSTWYLFSLSTAASVRRLRDPVLVAEWLIVLDQDISDSDSFPALNRVRGDSEVTSLECAINANSGSHDIDFTVCLGADHVDESCGGDLVADLSGVTDISETVLTSPFALDDDDRLTLLTEVNSGSATAAHCIAWGIER